MWTINWPNIGPERGYKGSIKAYSNEWHINMLAILYKWCRLVED
jgi:hypothetical protein